MRLRPPVVVAGIALVAGAAASAGCRSRSEGAPPRLGAPVRVSDAAPGSGQSEPAIAVDSAGRLVLVGWVDWSERVPHVRLARSTDGGASFAASRRILDPDPAHPRGQAEATLARAGRRFAFGWIGCRPDAESAENHACDVYASMSNDGGATWSGPIAIAEGGHVRRDRPWIVAVGDRFAVSWSEVGEGGSRWKLARETPAGAFETVAALDGRASVLPVAATGAGLEALLVDRSLRDPRRVAIELRTSGPSGDVAEPHARWSFPPEAALLEYSLGAFAAAPDGEAWLALPAGDGLSNDLALHHRAAAGSAFRSAGTLRGRGGRRVGLPWLIPLATDDRFLAAWAEERDDGWRVRARVLGPGVARSAPADVTPTPFRFHEASRTRNVGDFLGAAAAGDAFWIVWSDTRAGDADVWIARGHR